MDVDKTAGIIDTIKGMSSKELAVTLVLIVSCVLAAFWVENRYAKMRDTQIELGRQQQEILRQQQNVENLQKQVINVVNSLPLDVRKEIIERSTLADALHPDPNKFVKSN